MGGEVTYLDIATTSTAIQNKARRIARMVGDLSDSELTELDLALLMEAVCCMDEDVVIAIHSKRSISVAELRKSAKIMQVPKWWALTKDQLMAEIGKKLLA